MEGQTVVANYLKLPGTAFLLVLISKQMTNLVLKLEALDKASAQKSKSETVPIW